MQELIQDGKSTIRETDATLVRTEKVVEDTLAIGQQVGSAGNTNS